jgi:site-specific DNA-cytosine methylase
VQTTFSALPQDVKDIDSPALAAAGVRDGTQWLVVAGWECQDLSPAGKGRGLDGPRSSTFFDVIRILGAIQQMQQDLPPAYLLENVAMQHNKRSSKISVTDYARVVTAIGHPVTVDAAQFGSRSHRLRNFWCNFADTASIAAVLSVVKRPAGLLVDDILDNGRKSQPVRSPDFPPAYKCNRPGKPMEALPTLVAYPASRAFRDGKSGMVWDNTQGRLVEPNADERERALGYWLTAQAPPTTLISLSSSAMRLRVGAWIEMWWPI